MKLLSRIGLWLLPQQPTTVAPRQSAPADSTPAEPRGACGWFDSTHELVSGLRVQELATPESLAAELPLDCWLALQLRPGGRPGSPAPPG